MSHRTRALWLAFALAAASAPVATVVAQEHVGAEACGSCHEAQYKKWQASGHSMSLARLTKSQRRDRVCRSCHTMVANQDEPKLQGVQCESCHGAGSHYSPRWVMQDPVLSKLYGLEPVTDATCKPCHTGDGPSLKAFVYKEKVVHVCHVEKTETAKGTE
jgi:formate-dependent nitrite reductase cytochrome c552 subunit